MKHSLIDLWAAEHDLPLDTRGARRQVAWTIDRVRVHMREQATGEVLVFARVADLPTDERARGDVLWRAMSVSAVRMRHSTAVLATDEEAVALTLQVLLPSESDLIAMDGAVEHLVNEVETWRAVL